MKMKKVRFLECLVGVKGQNPKSNLRFPVNILIFSERGESRKLSDKIMLVEVMLSGYTALNILHVENCKSFWLGLVFRISNETIRPCRHKFMGNYLENFI